MKDRIPLYPGRVTLTPVAGQQNTYDMVRADQPQQDGTPLNKSTLLTDETANKLWNGAPPSDPTPNDAFLKVATALGEGVKIEMGSYTGTGTYGKSNPNTLTFSFEPKFVMVYGEGRSTDSSNTIGTHLAPAFFLNGKRGVTTFQNGTSYANYWVDLPATWSGNTLSWYQRADANLQKNASGFTYVYIAIG